MCGTGASNTSASLCCALGTAVRMLLRDSDQALTHSEPKVAGQCPRHTLKMERIFFGVPHVHPFVYLIPNACHNLGLICPKSSPALDCPHLASTPLISLLTAHLCRSLRSKLDFGVLHQAAVGKVWWEVYTMVIVFS